jgi:hypothetical protein
MCLIKAYLDLYNETLGLGLENVVVATIEHLNYNNTCLMAIFIDFNA